MTKWLYNLDFLLHWQQNVINKIAIRKVNKMLYFFMITNIQKKYHFTIK